jgi:hypothetical protein
MKIIYSAILMIGAIIAQVCSLPIIYSPHNTNNNNNQNQQIDIGPAIVVTRPHKPILYNPVNENETIPILYDENTNNNGIVPPPPPPAPPGPLLDDIMPAKFALPDGTIIYTSKDIKPFIISPFSDLEPVIE